MIGGGCGGFGGSVGGGCGGQCVFIDIWYVKVDIWYGQFSFKNNTKHTQN